MQERYGAPSRRRRTTVIVATSALAVVFLGWLAWVAVFNSDKPIDVQVSSYEVVSTHQINIKVESRFRDDAVQGSCLIRATARDHNIVGEVNLTVAEIRAARGSWIPIRTERRATTVETVRCTEKK